MPVAFDTKLEVAPDILIRMIEGESLILNIPAQEYLGLDEVGTRAWELVTQCASVEQAFQCMLAEYDVEPEVLRKDLTELLDQLVGAGLLRPDKAS